MKSRLDYYYNKSQADIDDTNERSDDNNENDNNKNDHNYRNNNSGNEQHSN